MSFCCGDQSGFIQFLEEQLMSERKVLLRYTGGWAEVEVAATGQVVKHRDTVEVPTSVAHELVDGGEFERVEDEAKATPKKNEKGDG